MTMVLGLASTIGFNAPVRVGFKSGLPHRHWAMKPSAPAFNVHVLLPDDRETTKVPSIAVATAR